jgi:hypothetical protein
MSDERFEQDFVWYEWGFVSPGEVPTDDLRVTGDEGQEAAAYRPPIVSDDEWRRWTA